MSLMCGGGGGGGETPKTPEEIAADAAMKKAADAEIAKQKKITKMLLLGAGESGKSTIFKQMKVINKNGYTKKELQEFTGIVHSNVIASMKAMLSSYEKLELAMPADVADLKGKFDAACGDDKLTPEGGAIVKQLWESSSIQGQFTRRNEYQLNDSAEFYFKDVDRIAAADYQPTTDDVLRSRVRTTGIVQSEFEIKGLNIAMFDVGGQRNERRKWIHCFDNVDCVVFVASLSEFDQVLFEDETMNRLDEAFDLFAQIVNSKWFKETAVILFLNKKDLFEQKLGEKNFADYVNKNEKREPYSGGNTMAECAAYTKKEFLKRNKNESKSIYNHVTTAIDTSNVKFVFNAVVGMILEENLKSSGLS